MRVPAFFVGESYAARCEQMKSYISRLYRLNPAHPGLAG
jgi:hypothetical protein